MNTNIYIYTSIYNYAYTQKSTSDSGLINRDADSIYNFPIHLEPNGIGFGSQSKRKLSPRSYIHFN